MIRDAVRDATSPVTQEYTTNAAVGGRYSETYAASYKDAEFVTYDSNLDWRAITSQTWDAVKVVTRAATYNAAYDAAFTATLVCCKL